MTPPGCFSCSERALASTLGVQLIGGSLVIGDIVLSVFWSPSLLQDEDSPPGRDCEEGTKFFIIDPKQDLMTTWAREARGQGDAPL